MISIAAPNDEVSMVFAQCLSRTRNPTLKLFLESQAETVESRVAMYSSLAPFEQLYLLSKLTLSDKEAEDLGDLYERGCVKGPGRVFYDKIRASSRLNRCPLCAQRDVQTIDHYLPISSFPEFAVAPLNLVPACSDCNQIKRNKVFDTYSDQTFHPYFDDWSSLPILKAAAEVTGAVSVHYFIECSEIPAPAWVSRAAEHFRLFELDSLYSQHAGVELIQRKTFFTDSYALGGSVGLSEDLLRESLSRRKPFVNAWQPALYLALAESADFCAGGFQLIDA